MKEKNREKENSKSKRRVSQEIHKDKQHKGHVDVAGSVHDAHDVINASKLYFFWFLGIASVLRLLMHGNLLAKILPLLLSECLCWIRRW